MIASAVRGSTPPPNAKRKIGMTLTPFRMLWRIILTDVLQLFGSPSLSLRADRFSCRFYLVTVMTFAVDIGAFPHSIQAWPFLTGCHYDEATVTRRGDRMVQFDANVTPGWTQKKGQRTITRTAATHLSEPLPF